MPRVSRLHRDAVNTVAPGACLANVREQQPHAGLQLVGAGYHGRQTCVTAEWGCGLGTEWCLPLEVHVRTAPSKRAHSIPRLPSERPGAGECWVPAQQGEGCVAPYQTSAFQQGGKWGQARRTSGKRLDATNHAHEGALPALRSSPPSLLLPLPHTAHSLPLSASPLFKSQRHPGPESGRSPSSIPRW